MSITTCPECGGKVSTQAEVCIHCGFRLTQQNKVEQAVQPNASPAEQPAETTAPVVKKEQKIDYLKEWEKAPEHFKKPMRTCEKGAKILKVLNIVM